MHNWVKIDPLTGRMLRQHKEFSLTNFNDGYVNKHGRFQVYFPQSKRAYKNGFIFRSIAAYELYHGVEVPKEYDIHHRNENRLDDSKENLELIKHGEHTKHHHTKERPSLICINCKKSFTIEQWRLKDSSRGKYCSQLCYSLFPRSNNHKLNISKSLKKSYAEGRR